MIQGFFVPDHTLPDRRMLNPEAVDSKYWTIHCVAGEAMGNAGFTVAGRGVRADYIGLLHHETQQYGLVPTPPDLRDRVIKPSDAYIRGTSSKRNILGGDFAIDWDTFVPVIPPPPSPEAGKRRRCKERVDDASCGRYLKVLESDEDGTPLSFGPHDGACTPLSQKKRTFRRGTR